MASFLLLKNVVFTQCSAPLVLVAKDPAKGSGHWVGNRWAAIAAVGRKQIERGEPNTSRHNRRNGYQKSEDRAIGFSARCQAIIALATVILEAPSIPEEWYRQPKAMYSVRITTEKNQGDAVDTYADGKSAEVAVESNSIGWYLPGGDQAHLAATHGGGFLNDGGESPSWVVYPPADASQKQSKIAGSTSTSKQYQVMRTIMRRFRSHSLTEQTLRGLLFENASCPGVGGLSTVTPRLGSFRAREKAPSLQCYQTNGHIVSVVIKVIKRIGHKESDRDRRRRTMSTNLGRVARDHTVTVTPPPARTYCPASGVWPPLARGLRDNGPRLEAVAKEMPPSNLEIYREKALGIGDKDDRPKHQSHRKRSTSDKGEAATRG
ncbi:hypothetical protein BV25DRAFT_1981280 [Artomyces pyxidatus]|uniref:Uncharacterized protein n=1 Tax=Artomyces pyxidatus TaxID=48021 RepID=A0ACB8SJR0_9AGAM|nr:hypothetical protein BV25DRAFT_1981280 [Artomyces pyxidatus]